MISYHNFSPLNFRAGHAQIKNRPTNRTDGTTLPPLGGHRLTPRPPSTEPGSVRVRRQPKTTPRVHHSEISAKSPSSPDNTRFLPRPPITRKNTSTSNRGSGRIPGFRKSSGKGKPTDSSGQSVSFPRLTAHPPHPTSREVKLNSSNTREGPCRCAPTFIKVVPGSRVKDSRLTRYHSSGRLLPRRETINKGVEVLSSDEAPGRLAPCLTTFSSYVSVGLLVSLN